MHYTIFFDKKPLRLTDDISDQANSELNKSNCFFEDGLAEDAVLKALKAIQKPAVSGGIVFHTDINQLLQAFKEKMKVIQAGGSLVYTVDEKFLLIFRKGKWDLPKGKLDKNETIEAAAVREVTEETGLKQIQLDSFLTTTYHTYYEKAKLILKESHWFLMKSTEQDDLVPQLEEDIEKCEWVKAENLATYLENIHPSVIDVLKTGIKKLHAAK